MAGIHPALATADSNSQIASLSQRVRELEFKLDETRKTEDRLFTPFAILVSILVAGGALGIVFSFRDQRRMSQLHELTVGGEVAAQRRTEQGYASFFEQSQTTLSLVNDTLELAKEANENAARTMKSQAQSRVDEIEERAQQLMFDLFRVSEFEAIITDPTHRGELESVAGELRSLEGFLSLQGIELPHYTRFIKAIYQFLQDDTEGALQALRLLSQDGAVGELQRFIEYWLGYMLTTVGEYQEAIMRFEHDELELDPNHPEHFQLERIVAETQFFSIANPKRDGRAADAVGDARGPHERFAAVAAVLDRLAELAAKIDASDDERAKLQTSLDVARVRADIYEWVAYDPSHLDDPVPPEAVEKAGLLNTGIQPAEAFLTTREWETMTDPEVVRAWALMQAQRICEQRPERDFDVSFALAECLFKLGKQTQADSAFANAENLAVAMVGEHHEKRAIASLEESRLICHSRLLNLREADEEQRSSETRHILSVLREALEVVGQMRQARVTVFSQIQRRNITQDELKEELRAIVEQDHLEEQ
jgi:tetratricopeptide (TPR) repeat protein